MALIRRIFQEILDEGASVGDGLYWFDPDGPGGNAAFQVPEPASLLLLGSGLAAVAAKARRRRKQRGH